MNWGELKAAVTGFMHRDDLTAMLDTFKELAEARIYYGSEDPSGRRIAPLRIFQMQDTLTADLPTLPAGFIEVVSLTATTSNNISAPLTYKAPEEFYAYERDSLAGYYTLKGGELVISSTPTDYSLLYYGKFEALEDDADTNWLLTNNSRVYLYAMLTEACLYTKDDAGAAKYSMLYASAVNGLNNTSNAGFGGVLTMPNPS